MANRLPADFLLPGDGETACFPFREAAAVDKDTGVASFFCRNCGIDAEASAVAPAVKSNGYVLVRRQLIYYIPELRRRNVYGGGQMATRIFQAGPRIHEQDVFLFRQLLLQLFRGYILEFLCHRDRSGQQQHGAEKHYRTLHQ
jgi:hypothetical protein